MTTAPRDTTLAIWDATGPIAGGARVAVKVAAKSRSGRSLSGERVVVVDSNGEVAAQGTLGAETWPGTNLVWTTLEVAAGSEPGLHRWTARVGDGAMSFSLVTLPPAEHTITVRVINETNEKAAPLAGTYVRAGAIVATTDADGMAVLHVPAGAQLVQMWKQRYALQERTVDVDSDIEITFSTEVVPDKDPQYIREHWI